jgi:putative ABC transport system ATP-binding protein
VKRPSLILADEPTGNLDSRTGDEVLDLLAGRCRELGATLLMATHSSRVSCVADRILCMVDGVLEEGDGGAGSCEM